MTNVQSDLTQTIQDLIAPGKGILAADESTGTIAKRLATISVDSTEENRLAYRQMLFTTKNLGEFISGVILFEETLGQTSTDGARIAEVLSSQGIVPGIKVDKGLVQLPNCGGEKTTQGLDNLHERLQLYKDQGARFAKWRAVYSISEGGPSYTAIRANAEGLARYAAICQEYGIVPIVEPEILMDGSHTIERCYGVSEWALNEVFQALYYHKVNLEHIVLKPSMVISGKGCEQQASVEQVAEHTVNCLKRTVPSAVPSINFLSGGQTPEQATQHLDAMNKLGPLPWYLSFSYGRALQEPALATWGGRADNISISQEALFKRAQLNSAATKGLYEAGMEA